MTRCRNADDVVRQLRLLASGDAVPDRVRRACDDLLQRLSSPVGVSLCGASFNDRREILSGLLGEADHETRLPIDDLASSDQELSGLRFSMFEDGLKWPRSTDIVLWVSGTCSVAEQAAWDAAPDALKDHAVLVAIAPDGTMGQRENAWADESFGATIVGESGASANLTARLRHHLISAARQGAEADLDNARMMLASFGHLTGAPADEVPANLASAVSHHEPSSPKGDDLSEFCRTAAQLIDRVSLQLDDMFSGSAEVQATPVLDLCAQTATALSEMTEETERAFPLADDLRSLADDVVLLSHEDSIDAATDAVTLLLQLRKDVRQLHCARPHKIVATAAAQ